MRGILGSFFRSFKVPNPGRFRDLIRRVRDCDQEAATELVRRYECAIRRVARIHLRDVRLRRVLDSMDICQSVLASFFVRTALGEYELDSPEQLLGLLTSITHNKVANQAHRLRAQRRDLRRDVPLDDQAYQIFDQASDPSEQESAKEILEKVRRLLGDDDRYLAEQRALGRGWQELADELGGTAAALRKRLSRALDRVMAELGLDEADHE